MSLSVFTKCPYYGYGDNHLKVDNPSLAFGAEILLCHPDAGCDRYYAVFWKTNIEATTHAIEGKEP